MIDLLLDISWNCYKLYWEDSKEKFLNKFKGYTLYPVENKNGIVGCVAVRDNQIHIFSKEHFNLRKYVRSILKPLLDEYDEVRSIIHIKNHRAYKFITGIGFEPYQVIGKTVYIRITKNGLRC